MSKRSHTSPNQRHHVVADRFQPVVQAVMWRSCCASRDAPSRIGCGSETSAGSASCASFMRMLTQGLMFRLRQRSIIRCIGSTPASSISRRFWMYGRSVGPCPGRVAVEVGLVVVLGGVEPRALHVPDLARISGGLGIDVQQHDRDLRIGQLIDIGVEPFGLHGARRVERAAIAAVFVVEDAVDRRPRYAGSGRFGGKNRVTTACQ